MGGGPKRGALAHYLAKICRKQHENEENWVCVHNFTTKDPPLEAVKAVSTRPAGGSKISQTGGGAYQSLRQDFGRKLHEIERN